MVNVSDISIWLILVITSSPVRKILDWKWDAELFWKELAYYWDGIIRKIASYLILQLTRPPPGLSLHPILTWHPLRLTSYWFKRWTLGLAVTYPLVPKNLYGSVQMPCRIKLRIEQVRLPAHLVRPTVSRTLSQSLPLLKLFNSDDVMWLVTN